MARHQYFSPANERACAKVQAIKERLYDLTCKLEDMEPDLFTGAENHALSEAVSALNACDAILAGQFT